MKRFCILLGLLPLTLTLALPALLAACAAEPPPSHISYGPPTRFLNMSPNTDMRDSPTTTSWGATDVHIRPVTPPPFKGI